jgi:hypothetical protein
MSGGLFEIRFRRPPGAANEAVRSAHLTEQPPFRQAGERGLHRYCYGCAQETEHVLCQSDDGPSIPAIRWPAAKPASGTTMCVHCGQWRVAASRPIAPAWSFWPRVPAEAGTKPDSRTPVHEAPLEIAAKNEGMPPLRPVPARLRRSQPARTMKNPIATY